MYFFIKIICKTKCDPKSTGSVSKLGVQMSKQNSECKAIQKK